MLFFYDEKRFLKSMDDIREKIEKGEYEICEKCIDKVFKIVYDVIIKNYKEW